MALLFNYFNNYILYVTYKTYIFKITQIHYLIVLLIWRQIHVSLRWNQGISGHSFGETLRVNPFFCLFQLLEATLVLAHSPLHFTVSDTGSSLSHLFLPESGQTLILRTHVIILDPPVLIQDKLPISKPSTLIIHAIPPLPCKVMYLVVCLLDRRLHICQFSLHIFGGCVVTCMYLIERF